MRSFNRTLARLSAVVLAAVVFIAVGLSALALAVGISAVFGSPAAYAQNLGDSPASRALDPNLPALRLSRADGHRVVHR
jgi:ABC-type dipeptide/oligopeptide/nickel transport system permease subunit